MGVFIEEMWLTLIQSSLVTDQFEKRLVLGEVVLVVAMMLWLYERMGKVV